MKKWILYYQCHPTGLMSPLTNLNKHFSTPSHYSLWKHWLLASIMATVHEVLWWSQNYLGPPLQRLAFSCGNNATVEALIQPHAEEHSLMFTDVECTHYINLDPINKQRGHSHSFLRYPLQKESYCTRIHHRAGLRHRLLTKRRWLQSLLWNERVI